MHWIVLIIPNLFVLVTYSEFKKKTKNKKRSLIDILITLTVPKKIKIPSEELKKNKHKILITLFLKYSLGIFLFPTSYLKDNEVIFSPK